MKNGCDNCYKICREAAGLTQIQAADLLHIGERTLSAYENGAKVPDESVASMVKVYNAPLLAWQHLKDNNVLGEYLPEFVMPQTYGDMYLNMSISHDELTKALDEVKKILSNGKIDDDEWDDFFYSMDLIKSVNSKLFSVIIYGQQLKKDG